MTLQSPGRRRIRRPWLVTFVLALAAGGLAGCAGGSKPDAPPPTIGTAMDRPMPDRIAAIPLTTADGKPTTLRDYRGRVVVMVDSSTLCRETCPLDSANFAYMARLLHRQGLGDKVQFIQVTMDPMRDTPRRVQAYQRLFGAPSGNWTFVTGTTADLKPLWSYFGFARTKEPIDDNPPPTDWMTGRPLAYDMNHNDVVTFLDQTGHERFVIVGQGDARRVPIPTTLREYLDREGTQDLTHPPSIAWTPKQALEVIGWLLGRDISTPPAPR